MPIGLSPVLWFPRDLQGMLLSTGCSSGFAAVPLSKWTPDGLRASLPVQRCHFLFVDFHSCLKSNERNVFV